MNTDLENESSASAVNPSFSAPPVDPPPCATQAYQNSMLTVHGLNNDPAGLADRIAAITMEQQYSASGVQNMIAAAGISCETHTFQLKNDLSITIVQKVGAPNESGIYMYYPIALFKGLEQYPDWESMVFYKTHLPGKEYMFSLRYGGGNIYYGDLSTDNSLLANLFMSMTGDEYSNGLPA